MSHQRKRYTIIVSAIILVVAIGFGIAYMMSRDASTTPPAATNVIDSVSRHIVLPKDEEPAILTVINKGEVSSAFLKGKVEDGDKVLIYQENQKVIIYRPNLDRIIDVGPAIVDDVEAMNNRQTK